MKKLCVPSKVFCRRLEPACEPWSAQRCFALPFRGRAGAHIPISDAHSGWTILETLLEGNADAPGSHAGWQPGLEGAHRRQRAERCETSEHELCPTFDLNHGWRPIDQTERWLKCSVLPSQGP